MREVTVLMMRKSEEIASAEDLVLDDLFGFPYQRAAALEQIAILPTEEHEPRELLEQLVEQITLLEGHASTILRYHNAWLDKTKLALTPLSRDVAALNAEMAGLEAELRAKYGLPDDFQFPKEET